MITVSFCSLAYRTEPIENLIPKIAESGYDAVEIFGGQLDGKTDDELRSIRKTAEDNHLGILAVAPYLSFTRAQSDYDESIERAKRFIHYADTLGAKKFRTFTDVGPTGVASSAASPEIWNQGIRGLKQLTALAPHLTFVLETHPLTLADTLESTQRVIKETAAANLKVLYQPSTPDFLNRGIIECWKILAQDTAHMHLQNTGDGNEHGWLEFGKMDLAKFISTVQADGYDGSMSVEYHWKDTPWDRVKAAYDFIARALGRAERRA